MSTKVASPVTIDAEVDAYNAKVAATVPRAAVATVSSRRARQEAVMRAFPPSPDDVARSDHWITLPGRELYVRVYRPSPGRLPALLYLHGGGWVAGSVQSHDGICAALARDADVVVASVHYRRPPENPCPAPNDDAYAALAWLAGRADALEVDAARLAIGGDSAGAHLAAGAALEARERGGPPLRLQVLIYPVVAPSFETASYRRHAVTATLTRDDMIVYWDLYTPGGAATADWRARPGEATLAGVPPAHVVVAGLDPLHDEGATLAKQLQDAGVTTTLVECPTLTHGFLRAAPYARAARAAQLAIGQAVAATLHGTSGRG